jgi:trehalose 6-phosphate phosphatase
MNATIPHLLEHRREELRRFAIAKRVLVALDFDGTISPIARTPEAARVSPRAARAIERLRALGDPGLRLALVSGRRVVDLERLAPPVDLRIGLHGFEIQEESAPLQMPFDTRKSDAALDELRTRLEPLHALGARIEDKQQSIAVHVRGLDAERAPVAGEAFAKLVDDLRKAGAPVNALMGKAVIEARPAEASKARALARFVEAPVGSRLVFAGDDATDEEVFAAFPAELTVAVFEIERPTAARTRVRSPDEVAAMLEAFHDERVAAR